MYILDLYIINRARILFKLVLRETYSHVLQLKAAVTLCISDNFFFIIILLLECANSS